MGYEIAASYKLERCDVHRDSKRVEELQLYLFCILH